MAGPTSSELTFFVNGKKVVELQPDPDLTLLQYLRDTLRLRGTKSACGEGGCGACTVMISNYDRSASRAVHKAVTACLTPLCSVHGCAVTTVEGVGSIRNGLHPIQKRLVEQHGIQCGFCTPGMVMSLYALLRNNASPSREDIEKALDGNLCRCTGYRPILQAFDSFSKEFTCGLGDQCCKNKKVEPQQEAKDGKPCELLPYDPSQEPIFPSELQVSDQYDKSSLKFESKSSTWFRPTTLSDVLALRSAYPSSILVAGFTGASFMVKHMPADEKKVLISLSGLKEMQMIEASPSGLTLGAGLTINAAAKALCAAIEERKDHSTRGLQAVLTIFDRYASQLIRNMATLGGSLAIGNANSDAIVPLVAAGAYITVMSKDGQKKVALKDWCSSGQYKSLTSSDIIKAITIPFTVERQYVFTFKQSSRRATDRAIVNAGMSVTLGEKSPKIEQALLCFGGVAPGVILAKETATKMVGKLWNSLMLEDVSMTLNKELMSKEVADKKEYRRSLALGFLFKYFQMVSQMNQQNGSYVDDGGSETMDVSGCLRETNRASQVWEEVPADQPQEDLVGRPTPLVSARQQATGEAGYYSDIPKREDEVYLAMVRSTKAHAEILTVDPSEALKMPGVVGYVGHEDVPGSNQTGLCMDELIFAVDKVECMGDVIGGIAAETELEARRAAQKVKVTYKELPLITTIEDAIKKSSFLGDTVHHKFRGDVDKGFASADHVKEGTIRMGCQDHFYMETQFSYVVPLGETEEYEVFVCTQGLVTAQNTVASALNIPRNKVAARQRRMGGAFGGKENRPVATLVLLPAAVAAYKFRRPVRCQLTREEDMTTTGGRHPAVMKYKVGFKNDGRITGVAHDLYLNAGSVSDVSQWVAGCAAVGAEGTYQFDDISVKSRCCKTNTPSPTSMRAFGKPQGVFACESVIEDVADALGMLPEKVRAKNLGKEGYSTFSVIPLKDQLHRCWDELNNQCNFEGKRQELKEFNRINRWKKRGMSAIPIKFEVGFPFPSMWQGGAFVLVYLDGSVLLSHGGIEMGQGIHTKMIQIASRELGIPADQIHIAETTTSTVPNASTTGGSSGTDLNGPAVMNACRKIKERLTPVVKANPSGTWKDWVNAAYQKTISLSATGFYCIPESEIPAKDWTPCLYFTYGAACTVVEVDCLTGEHAILQTDIVMDVGRSLNPGIDIGQIEGGFMQGRGLFTMEEIVFTSEGYMKTRGPDSYKIPTVADIPMTFNVTLLKGSDNPRAVYSSKGIGEPPLLLATTVFFAIKDAIKAARAENGLKGRFDLDSPATVERIRMACTDKITALVTGTKDDCKPEWTA